MLEATNLLHPRLLVKCDPSLAKSWSDVDQLWPEFGGPRPCWSNLAGRRMEFPPNMVVGALFGLSTFGASV